MMNGLVLLMNTNLPLKDPVPIFSLVLFIILLAPILLRKLRIPSIIGLIIAGMLIGDHGFKIIQKDSIDLFAKAGLLYIMFLAGLELDMTEFRKNRYRSMVFGAFTFFIPLTMGFVVCTYVLQFNFMATLLVSSMFATHTLVAYPLASRLGITKNEAVTVAVGGTIITDTAVLLILAVITGAQAGNLNTYFWVRLGISLAIFAAIILWLMPMLGRWFFKKIKDDKTSHFIFVLALVFASAFLAELAGVEGIIGAFLAGLALNQLIPHTSPLMNRIEFVGNAIFIPFFLISVGMLVDLRVLLKGPEALIIAGALTLMALSSKWLAALFTQLVFKYSANQRKVIFGLSSAHAAATIAVILIGYNMHIVDEHVLNGTVILILITCLVGSFVTENAGRRLAIQEAEGKPEADDQPERILVPVSNPDRIEALLDFAVMIKDSNAPTPIYPLAVVQDNEEAKEKIHLTNKMLEKAVIHAAATESAVQVVTRIDLNVSDGITRATKELLISDVILGWTDKTSTTDRWLGNIFGTTLDNVLQRVWETVYVCNFHSPLNTTKKMVLVMPPNAEYELGFLHYMQKMFMLAKQAGARLLVFCNEKTQTITTAFAEQTKMSVDLSFRQFDTIEDFLILSREITRDDLVVVVTARKSTLSYHAYMDGIPAKLERHFKDNNVILLYPEQREFDSLEAGLQSEDLTLAPIQEQIANLNKLGKAVKRIFKK
ncbi:cation:proton antiporter [Chitinophaga ginsengisegetis]|uniref:cation:proton antiporter n=1 Tax=Chitinophaga ginsengisegetis TaxID=393003 RepID=UPI000DBF89C9|nr:cation:proton antiporter [Chitinophaga ginsengisegetis]MDR6569752.1 Kef-type K+ transport system membrane component KefB [Chitinophaga ginsengisegetis]MDR6649485.1 Kef-type K+ transport system membrane component KefB [Chitinophaga ginsengisegetis]MDR6655835.1 Kef-type K+ transport system membrane component KefB [Chitinophaga ginsengisegetis]